MQQRKFLAVSERSATPIGDIREAGLWCVIIVSHDATKRRDWSRYWEAIGAAYVRGAQVVTQ
jgi:hypothetical protein